MAPKLHCQFVHPTPDKLINLVNNAGIPWSKNNELREEIQKICNCFMFKIYGDLWDLWDYPWPQDSKRW